MVSFFYSLPILVALDMINYKYLQLIVSSLILSVFTIQILLMFVFMTKNWHPRRYYTHLLMLLRILNFLMHLLYLKVRCIYDKNTLVEYIHPLLNMTFDIFFVNISTRKIYTSMILYLRLKSQAVERDRVSYVRLENKILQKRSLLSYWFVSIVYENETSRIFLK